MTTKSITAIATMLLALCATDATAQTANEGRKVKQLRFDKEKVTIVYNNGDTEEATDDIVIHRSEATPIKEVANNKSSDSKSPGTWYTIDGRKIENKKSANTKLPKGVYVKKEGNRTRKTIVK